MVKPSKLKGATSLTVRGDKEAQDDYNDNELPEMVMADNYREDPLHCANYDTLRIEPPAEMDRNLDHSLPGFVSSGTIQTEQSLETDESIDQSMPEVKTELFTESDEHLDCDVVSDFPVSQCTNDEEPAEENCDMVILTENDIPGASLGGIDPRDLNVTQLKRWLVCRDAPVSGNKPQLIQRVYDYIKYGWDIYIIDPDGGSNVKKKLLEIPSNTETVLLQSMPKSIDTQWTKEIHKIPKVTFSTIYQFLVERKALVQKADRVDNIIERRNSSLLHCEGDKPVDSDIGDPIVYTRTLDKAYRFFVDGHVQKIRYHPMPTQPDVICIGSSVLPSMKKNKMYNVFIVVSTLTAQVKVAFCVCPAGLSGCCNHVTATLYYIEEYFRLGMDEEDRKGCTEKLRAWIQPRSMKVDARPTDLVRLTKKVYGVEKRPKLCSVNNWDCRPTSRRVLQPERKANLWNRLVKLDQSKKAASTCAILTATNDVSKKKAVAAQSKLLRYGTSCFIQLFDDEPAPSINRTQQMREERRARAESKQIKFKQDLSRLIDNVGHDHCYCSTETIASQHEVNDIPAPLHLVRQLYEEHICIGLSEAAELEMATRQQSKSDLWHEERKLRITSSIMKSVCNRRMKSDVKVFLRNKLFPKPINSPAIKYGERNEEIAIQCYIKHQEKKGVVLNVKNCGLFVNPAIPWLAATPDSVIEVGKDTGCLEVKCPFVCSNKSFSIAAVEVPSFCLEENNGRLQLRRKHQYFYQIQTQLFVTQMLWCDFVVWSPNEGIVVERISYDEEFSKMMISKARTFYFDTFLSSAVPCTTISFNSPHATASSVFTCAAKEEPLTPHQENKESEHCEDIQLLSISPDSRPSIDLFQQLGCVRHPVNGDGNCLYYSIAHQAGLIEPDCHGDTSIAIQLRTLALICMQKYPGVCLEDGMTPQQWEQKKLRILHQGEWGGDLEVRLLDIGLSRELIVVTGSRNTFTFARRFPFHPPPIPKMRGGIFIPMNVAELLEQWKSFDPFPLLIIYNGINHYDSTVFIDK